MSDRKLILRREFNFSWIVDSGVVISIRPSTVLSRLKSYFSIAIIIKTQKEFRVDICHLA